MGCQKSAHVANSGTVPERERRTLCNRGPSASEFAAHAVNRMCRTDPGLRPSGRPAYLAYSPLTLASKHSPNPSVLVKNEVKGEVEANLFFPGEQCTRRMGKGARDFESTHCFIVQEAHATPSNDVDIN